MKRALFILISGLVTGLCNGLFGAGGGMVAVPAMIHILDMDEHEAHATALAVIFPLSIISTIIYFKSRLVAWDITWKVALGSTTGGFIGAKLLKKIPANILRKIFAIFMIVAAVRMII